MNVGMIQEGGIGAYAAIALGLLGIALGFLALISFLGKSRSAFSLGIATLVMSAATAGAGMLGTVYGRYQVSRAVAFVGSNVDIERIMRAGFREAQSSSWVGLFAAVLPLMLGAAAAFGGSRMQPARGPTQGFGGPVVSSDDGLGGQSMIAIVFSIIALLASCGAWAMAHSELPKLRYAIDENDGDSWQLAEALESMNKPGACEKLEDALEPFWGATDETLKWEWPRKMRTPISSELKWRPVADECAKTILGSLDDEEKRGSWTQDRLLRSALLQDEAIHAATVARTSKTPNEDPLRTGILAALGGTGVVGKGNPPADTYDGDVERLSPAEVAKTVRADLKNLRACYERELIKSPSLSGKLMVHFTVGNDGKVVSAEEASDVTFPSVKVTSCVLTRFKLLKFPATPGAAPVTVNYPFVFQAAK